MNLTADVFHSLLLVALLVLTLSVGLWVIG
jgi:hypothetical protein